jgi:DNA-binding beta-propeller fold protein YncE
VLAGVTAAAVLVAIGVVLLTRHPAARETASERSTVALLGDAADAPASQIVIDGSASAIAAEGTDLWVADDQAGTVTRIHTDTLTSERPVSSGIDPIAITAGDGRAWVLDPFAGRIKALDASGQIDSDFEWHWSTPVDAVFAHGSLWVVDSACGCVFQVDASTGKRVQMITSPFAGAGPIRIDAGPGAIWVLNGVGRSLVRISPWNGRPVGVPIDLPYQPVDLAVSKDSVWVSMEANDLVEKLSLSGVSEGDIRVPGGPSTIVADASGAWVLTSRSGQVVRLVGQVGSRVRLTAPPAALAIGDGGAWVSWSGS